MAGNSKRKGAIRKPGSKKGAQAGSGGKGRRSLEGKGPTPKAEDRPYHVAHRRKNLAERTPAAPRRVSGGRGGGSATEVVAGRNAVLEALRAQIEAEGLFVFNHVDADDRITEIVEFALDRNIKVEEVPKADLEALTDGAKHQGVALTVPPYDYAAPDDLLGGSATPLIVALDSIQDPRNLGAIMRSAAAFGATGVLVPERRAAGVTVSAWKVSAGAAARIRVARATNLARTLGDYKKQHLFVVGLDGGGDMELADSELLNEPLVLVVGSEGKGLSRLVREACDQVVSIPISAATESLNASVAASLALYETRRARS